MLRNGSLLRRASRLENKERIIFDKLAKSVQCVINGYLTMRQEGVLGAWTKYFFVLDHEGRLFYFKSERDTESVGCIDIKHCEEVSLVEQYKGTNVIKIITGGDASGSGRAVLLSNNDHSILELWLQALVQSSSAMDFVSFASPVIIVNKNDTPATREELLNKLSLNFLGVGTSGNGIGGGALLSPVSPSYPGTPRPSAEEIDAIVQHNRNRSYSTPTAAAVAATAARIKASRHGSSSSLPDSIVDSLAEDDASTSLFSVSSTITTTPTTATGPQWRHSRSASMFGGGTKRPLTTLGLVSSVTKNPREATSVGLTSPTLSSSSVLASPLSSAQGLAPDLDHENDHNNDNNDGSYSSIRRANSSAYSDRRKAIQLDHPPESLSESFSPRADDISDGDSASTTSNSSPLVVLEDKWSWVHLTHIDYQKRLQDYLSIMTRGSVAVKFPYLGGGSGKPRARFFQLSKDLSHLYWGTDISDVGSRKLEIAKIRSVVIGHRTKTFKCYGKRIKQTWRSISLVVAANENSRAGRRSSGKYANDGRKANKNRTIDLLLFSDEEALAWYVGLSFLLEGNKGVEENSDHSLSLSLDQRLQKSISDWRWNRLRLQIAEKADRKGVTVGKLVCKQVHKAFFRHLQEQTAATTNNNDNNKQS